jgi:hypothetical protein
MMILVMELYQQVIRKIRVGFNKQIVTKKKDDYLPRIFDFFFIQLICIKKKTMKSFFFFFLSP